MRAFLLSATLCCAGALTACASAGPDTALTEALAVELDGFEPVSAGAPPTQLCQTSPGSDGEVPRLHPALRDPAAAAYESDEGRLEAYAWTTPDAGSIVDGVTAGAEGCEYELTADYDLDGDGELDAGGSETQGSAGWEGSGWRGVAISTQISRPGESETREARLVHAGDVVLLVVVDHGGAGSDERDAVVAAADDFLAAVAEQLD